MAASTSGFRVGKKSSVREKLHVRLVYCEAAGNPNLLHVAVSSVEGYVFGIRNILKTRLNTV